MSSDRVFERRIVSKRRTSANLEDEPAKQCPNGWASVVAAASSRPKTAAKNLLHQRTPFQSHPDSNCDWFFKVSEKYRSKYFYKLPYHIIVHILCTSQIFSDSV